MYPRLGVIRPATIHSGCLHQNHVSKSFFSFFDPARLLPRGVHSNPPQPVWRDLALCQSVSKKRFSAILEDKYVVVYKEGGLIFTWFCESLGDGPGSS
jgi:hypothetical protein